MAFSGMRTPRNTPPLNWFLCFSVMISANQRSILTQELLVGVKCNWFGETESDKREQHGKDAEEQVDDKRDYSGSRAASCELSAGSGKRR
jgi:hypothetical protein